MSTTGSRLDRHFCPATHDVEPDEDMTVDVAALPTPHWMGCDGARRHWRSDGRVRILCLIIATLFTHCNWALDDSELSVGARPQRALFGNFASFGQTYIFRGASARCTLHVIASSALSYHMKMFGPLLYRVRSQKHPALAQYSALLDATQGLPDW